MSYNTSSAPTQTHILLRAPRRFTHPSWIPRQNLSRTLESTLQTFLEDAFASNDHRPQSINSRNKHPRVGIATEGVWIGCQYDELHSLSGDRCPEEEDDEMIWWAWNGKIVGFSEW